MTPVIEAVVSPVARASPPAVSEPLKLRMFRQLRSVALIPIRSAAAWPTSCMSEPVIRRAAPNSVASRARSGDSAPNGSAHGNSQPDAPPAGVSPSGALPELAPPAWL